MTTTHASARDWRRSHPIVGFLRVVVRVVGAMWRFFFPPKPKRPIGYWARNERGQWEIRIPAYSLKEEPPTAR